MADDVRLTLGSVVRLIGAGLGGYARVLLVENMERLVVDVTGIAVRVHASRTYAERWRAEGIDRVELRVVVVSIERVEPTPTARPRRPRRPRAAAERVTEPRTEKG